ncbi:hypothetical protein D9757_009471 [Collybiopsis confluens]|uniref:Protein kinase domain-containing protein n=1 Tax=Collybiopsis confluens TaxID=2823264 RepID=A0A8H5M0H0_9AGAR|nr:hypothetical protein D9757_009471 [Collybiopsis confluens]
MRDSAFFRYSLLSIRDFNLTLAATQLDRGEGKLPIAPEDFSESRRLTESIARLYTNACEFREQYALNKDPNTLQKALALDRQGLTMTAERSSLHSRSSGGSSHSSHLHFRPYSGSSYSSRTHSGSTHRSHFHNFFRYSLAYDLCTQYETSNSDILLLHDSTQHLQALLRLRTLDDTLRQFALEDLSWNLHTLYAIGADDQGLSRAIDYSRTARDLVQYSNNVSGLYPESNLAFYLHTRYQIEQDIQDLDEVIQVVYQDLDTGLSSERRYKSLAILTSSLRKRYDCDEDVADLEEVISYDRELLNFSMSDSDRAIWLSLLADDLSRCFSVCQEVSVLEEAVVVDQKILQLLPVNSQEYEQSLRNLSSDLKTAFFHEADAKTLIGMIRCDKQMLKQEVDDSTLSQALQCLELLHNTTSSLNQVLLWWQGRLPTVHLIRVLAPMLDTASTSRRRLSRSPLQEPNLCDRIGALLRLKESDARRQIWIDAGEGDSDAHFITLVSQEGNGEIIPISFKASSVASSALVKSSQELRSILQSIDPMASLISMDPLLTPSVMQLLQLEIDAADSSSDYRRKCLRILQKLSRTHHVLPPSLFLRNITLDGNRAATGGGFADIWKGTWDGRAVCLKVLRMFLDSDAKVRKKVLHAFCNEALVWKQLKHPNILPLLGVNVSLFAPSFCLISPWIQHGDVNHYMKANPNFDKLTALTEIAAGLQYLHGLTPPVVHGDLRGANILVMSDGGPPRCCLADFGLALVAETQTLTSTTEIRGASRWMAPEFIDPTSYYPDFDSKHNRLPGDVYAFACTVIEILTEKPPFYDQYHTDSVIIIEVLDGGRPLRPESKWCSDTLWELISECWAPNPWERPLADDLYARLETMSAAKQEIRVRSSDSWEVV